MKKQIFILLLLGIIIFSIGCTENINGNVQDIKDKSNLYEIERLVVSKVIKIPSTTMIDFDVTIKTQNLDDFDIKNIKLKIGDKYYSSLPNSTTPITISKPELDDELGGRVYSATLNYQFPTSSEVIIFQLIYDGIVLYDSTTITDSSTYYNSYNQLVLIDKTKHY